MSRWRSNPPPRWTASLTRGGRYEGSPAAPSGRGRRPFREPPSSGRVVGPAHRPSGPTRSPTGSTAPHGTAKSRPRPSPPLTDRTRSSQEAASVVTSGEGPSAGRADRRRRVRARARAPETTGRTRLGAAPGTPRKRGSADGAPRDHIFRPRIRRDYPLDLSISASGGKETNKDSLSSGERTGRSPAPNPVGGSRRPGNVVFGRVRSSRSRFSERRPSGRRPGPVHGPNAASGPKKPRPGTASCYRIP